MDDDVRMVELLAEARQWCEGLTEALTRLRNSLAYVDESAGTAQTSAEDGLDSLCEKMERVTEAANAASTTLGAGGDRAAAAVARVQEEAGNAREGVAALVTRTETSAEKLDLLLRGLQDDVRARVTQLDAGLVALGTEMTAFQGVLAPRPALLAAAIDEVRQQLEEACSAHDAAQLDWGAATDALLGHLTGTGGTLSRAMAHLADRHAEFMVGTFNASADRHNGLMASMHASLTDKLEPEVVSRRQALDKALAELSMRADERTLEFRDADTSTERDVPGLVTRLTAALEQLRSTQELQP